MKIINFESDKDLRKFVKYNSFTFISNDIFGSYQETNNTVYKLFEFGNEKKYNEDVYDKLPLTLKRKVNVNNDYNFRK